MKRITLLLVAVLVSCTNIFAQQEATTIAGKKVILNDDGTWKYADETKTTETKVETIIQGDCSTYIETTEDKMTGKKSVSSIGTIIVSTDSGKTGFGIFAVQKDNYTILVIQAIGAGNCIDEGAKINILFRDGSKLELQNDADFNCKAKATVYFGDVFGKKKELAQLMTKEIDTMRVWTNDSYVQEDFTSDNSVSLMMTIKCLNE